MKYWGGRLPPAWARQIANERPRALNGSTAAKSPRRGDVVLKPFIDPESYHQLFRLEAWGTHDLLDGPFSGVREALQCALEFSATSHLVVWLDYSDDPAAHDLDPVPLYDSDLSSARYGSVA